MKVAFVDRDGTINKDYPDDDWRYIYEPEFLDGSLEALKVINQKGSNNHYYKSIPDKWWNHNIITVQKIYRKAIALDTFYCPHSIKENCNCFKPKTGLVDMALKKYPHIELNKSFIVGDSVSDIELGNRLGIMTFGINVNSGLFDYTRIKYLLDIIKYL